MKALLAGPSHRGSGDEEEKDADRDAGDRREIRDRGSPP